MIGINCISTPRNISTALMYAFRERNDTSVIDEPFYAFYLAKTGKVHPGRDEILNSQPHDPATVFQSFDECTTPVLYIKNMAHHMRLLEADHFNHYKTLLLIRDPRQLIASFAQIIDEHYFFADEDIFHPTFFASHALFAQFFTKGPP